MKKEKAEQLEHVCIGCPLIARCGVKPGSGKIVYCKTKERHLKELKKGC